MKIYGNPGSNTRLGAVQVRLGGGGAVSRGSPRTLAPSSGSASHLPAYVPPAAPANTSPGRKIAGSGASGAAGGVGGSIGQIKAGKKWTKKG